jgi:hypothetical protein
VDRTGACSPPRVRFLARGWGLSGPEVKNFSTGSLRLPEGHRANRSVSAPSVGDTAVRFPNAIVGIVLTEFSAYVWSNEPGVRHYGRQG